MDKYFFFFFYVWKSDWIAALFSSGFLSEVKAEADFIWICPICIKFECGTWKQVYILMLWRSGMQDINAKNCSRSMCETVWIILRMLYYAGSKQYSGLWELEISAATYELCETWR